MKRPKYKLNLLLLCMILLSAYLQASDLSCNAFMRKNFVLLSSFEPSIRVDMRYFFDYNFMGRSAKGYQEPLCILTKRAAIALRQVQHRARQEGFRLLVWDCYRPQQAVNDFVAWSKTAKEQSLKRDFFPNLAKSQLFKQGYIAKKSGHSGGSTVDLTLEKVAARERDNFRAGRSNRLHYRGVTMGTNFDYLDPASHTHPHPNELTKQQRHNRHRLLTLMNAEGFKNYPKEWWHYSLEEEPFPNLFFNCPVRNYWKNSK